MVDIVIDIETLGTRPGCTIIEIGACAIDGRTGEITANFSRRVAHPFPEFYLERVAMCGRSTMSSDLVDTVVWWNEDPERAKTFKKVSRGGIAIGCALSFLCGWIFQQSESHDAEDIRVWSNGPAFDIAILAEHFRLSGIRRPWICWQERCVRTALEQAGYVKGSVPWIERGPRHRALNDARHEARKLYHAGALGEVSAIIKRLHQRGAVAAANH